MSFRKLSLVMAMLCGVSSVALATPIGLNMIQGFGLWTDAFGGNLLPQGSYVQVWWSVDSSYGQSTAGEVGLTEASLTDTAGNNYSSSYGDYVLWQGSTQIDGGWGDPTSIGTFTDLDVNGQHIGPANVVSSGHVYVYIYDTTTTPQVNDRGIMTEIYGPNGDIQTVWQNAADPQSTADSIAASTSDTDGVLGGSNGFVVVPEPGTMALFGIGALTLAARRRRKTA